jgi:hypothetical protein
LVELQHGVNCTRLARRLFGRRSKMFSCSVLELENRVEPSRAEPSSRAVCAWAGILKLLMRACCGLPYALSAICWGLQHEPSKSLEPGKLLLLLLHIERRRRSITCTGHQLLTWLEAVDLSQRAVFEAHIVGSQMAARWLSEASV